MTSLTLSFANMPITMPADAYPELPDAGRPPNTRDCHSPARHYDWRNAATVFGAVIVSLGGIFAILEYSTRHTDKTHANIDYRFDMVDERFKTVDERFKTVDERFNAVDRQFALVDRQLQDIGTRLDKMDQRFDKMDERFDRTDQRFDKMEAKFDRKFDRLTEVLQSLVEQKPAPGDSLSGAATNNRAR